MPVLIDIITKGSTDQSLTLRMADSTDGTPETGVTSATTGVDVWYRRQGGAKVSLTESNLSALTDAHSDGGLLHISDGEYRVDFPDAAFASGADWVDVGWGATGMVGFGGRVRLIAANLEDATRLGLTALPNAAADAAGGLPISDAGGLDLDTLNSNVSAILSDTGTDGVVVASGSKSGYALSSTGMDAVTLPANIITATSIATDAITAAKIAADAIGASELAADAVTEIQSGLATAAKLLKYVQLLARSDAAIATDNATELTAINADGGSGAGDFSNQTEAVEALRDHIGDGTNLTEAGGTGDQLTALATAAQATAIVADTNELQTDWANGGRLDLILDELTTQGDTNEAAIGALNDPTAAAIADAVWDENIEAAHGTDATAGLLLRVLGAAISNRANNATLHDLLGIDDLPGYDLPLMTWAEEIVDGAAPTAANAIQNLLYASLTVSGTVNDPGASGTTTTIPTDLTGYGDDIFNDQILKVVDGAQALAIRAILDYNSTTGLITIDEPLAAALADNVNIQIIPIHVHPTSQIADAVWDEASSGHTTAGTFGKLGADVLADTNELQTDLTNGGRLDLILDELTTNVDAVETDTQDIQSRLPAALVNSRMDSTIDATGMEAGAIDAIWTTALTEAYRSTGAAGTAAQLLHEILQNITEFAISGTTKTVKKFDGSTTAKTYTLDSSTTPTSITEAT